MRTRYTAYMNGKGLQDIDPTIVITDIREKAPSMRNITSEKGWGHGSRYVDGFRESLAVGIRFMIREYDVNKRRDICSRIRAWAQEGYLTDSEHQGQRLYVVCTAFPNVDSAMKWTTELDLTLTAYDVPFWENETPSKASTSGTSGTLALALTGSTDAPLNFLVTASENITDFTVSVNGGSMSFSGLSTKRLEITHDSRGILSVKAGDASALSKRTSTSSDDLQAHYGSNTISYTCNTSCTVVATARGRYL